MTKKTIILIGFIIAKFLLQYSLISPEYELQRDEFLHLDQGHHLAWGYLSVPPLTSLISYIIYLLGNTVFWVKFFPALFGALTIVVVWKVTEELKGSLFALILGATCILFSVLLRLNLLYQPNSLDVLSWTTFYFLLIKFINTEKPKWLFLAAIIFALGFLNKYNIIFLLLGLFPAVLITEQRRILIQKKVYMAILLGLLLISPNLLWQYNNNFPVFHHLKQLSELQLVNVNRWLFLKEQLLFFIGSLFVILTAFYALLFYAPFKPYKLFFWSIIFTLLIFVYLKAKGYYAIGLYPVYISFGAVFLENLLKTGWRKYLRPVSIAIPVLFFIPMYSVIFPNKSPEYIIKHPAAYQKLGLLRWEDGKDHQLPQDFADMLGWKELAEKVDKITLASPDTDLILCDNYGQTGAINFYSKNKAIRASSFDADYNNWFSFDKKMVNVILVKELDDEDKERKEEIPLFDKVFLADKRVNSFAREQVISIYVLRGAKVDINKRIRDEMNEKKNY
ncbi:Dolichyl-phosphate-mannose-protein mannosyltransferase [Pseudarcicella hirudinis]|uniref:Dolichyl-phosphate-mannose-protein mannosyltransferase n=1 Tax=Pseudarcicella hirudinis TaxID=1079859 RepID=A0A1I5M3P1_9BACT|nr:glycosyltransferase family 39 protein [Pseudarcicella hirudinis]SFP04224.1 Dolichyl-phosphate-mannose-protein mannosyltransferase [Pseudarcicella hirudinis]